MRFGRILAIGALALSAAAAPAATQQGPFDWLVGDWRSERPDQEWTLEHWEPMADGAMAGRSSSGRGAAVTNTEVMRIRIVRGSAIFTASPNGQPPVDFRETRRAAQAITFENAAHDFPQRIRLWREGEALAAEISLLDGSQAISWSYSPIRE